MRVAQGFLGGSLGKESACQCRRRKRLRFDPWVGKILWIRTWQPIPVFLSGESHGQRTLEGYSPGGHKKSDTTATTNIHTYRKLRNLYFQYTSLLMMSDNSGSLVLISLWFSQKMTDFLRQIPWKLRKPQLLISTTGFLQPWEGFWELCICIFYILFLKRASEV